MRLDAIRPLYEQGEGPFASVYLDTSRADESGAAEVELRWRRLREQLLDAGADAETLDAIGRLVTSPAEAAPGRAVFATGGRVVYDEPLPHPPRREIARWSPLPHVMPLLAQRGESVPHLRVLADHTGAEVVVVGAGAPRRTAVGSEDWPMQKTGQGGWSQKRYERGVEETWERNAIAVAETVDKEARRVGAELVVVAGEPASRALVCEHLDAYSADRVVMAEHGKRAQGAAREPFERDAEEAVDDWVAHRREELIEHYGEGPSATGLQETVRALRNGQVDTLLLADDPHADGVMWIGPEGGQLAVDRAELVEWGVPEPRRERADAALARAVATTDAELWFVARESLGTDVAALLRY
ncbi:hypothetical protein HNP84_006111 [Thermocatellispora tengchongensis]|uniref:Peptide chain release factor 1 n=1 Tax=Thermocatellispora tengchongensis TaxID=1073253 RepID=A0A840P4Y4_9ACTN|nr:Vms1/Ankzf1 family peptidyl-tRNA hydrolase [Thermocatellispora tengchongensis]MBB5136364.1 hypothetical protein [Thermocatellispora tengchongensis]